MGNEASLQQQVVRHHERHHNARGQYPTVLLQAGTAGGAERRAEGARGDGKSRQWPGKDHRPSTMEQSAPVHRGQGYRRRSPERPGFLAPALALRQAPRAPGRAWRAFAAPSSASCSVAASPNASPADRPGMRPARAMRNRCLEHSHTSRMALRSAAAFACKRLFGSRVLKRQVSSSAHVGDQVQGPAAGDQNRRTNADGLAAARARLPAGQGQPPRREARRQRARLNERGARGSNQPSKRQ